MASTTGRRVVEYLTNKSGGAVAIGDVVIVDTGNDSAFTTTTTGAYTGTIGVAQEAIANNAAGRVCTAGQVDLVNVNASVTRGNFAKTYTAVKQATDAGSSRVEGVFGQFLTGGTTPKAHLFGIADAIASGGTTHGNWTDYTPTITASGGGFNKGSSSLTGRYKQLDSNTYIVRCSLTVTTGGAWNAGSGDWSFSLPAGLTAAGTPSQVGSAHVLDSGTARFAGSCLVSNGGTTIVVTMIADATSPRTLAATNPVTWATGDLVDVQITIEVA